MSFKKFIIFGSVGMLLDLDHMIPAITNGVPINQIWDFMVTHGVRTLHIPGLWLSLMVFMWCWANEPETDEVVAFT